jgi:hypothetical protein
MYTCVTCRNVIIGNGYKNDGDRYCSAMCLGYSPTGRFCDECESETTEDGASWIYHSAFVLGTSLLGASERCPRCYSVVQRKWMHLLVPLPRHRYRVLYLRGNELENEFVSRRVKEPLPIPVRRRERPNAPRPGSPAPAPRPRDWWSLTVVGLFVAGWAIYDYVTLSALEQEGGRWDSPLGLEPIHLLMGKWGVVGLDGSVALALLVFAFFVRRAATSPLPSDSASRN